MLHLQLLFAINRSMSVHQPDDPFLWRHIDLVQSSAIDVVYIAQQAQGFNTHPPPILHHPGATSAVIDDICGDLLNTLPHVDADELLLSGALVRADGAHADAQGLLRWHLMLA